MSNIYFLSSSQSLKVKECLAQLIANDKVSLLVDQQFRTEEPKSQASVTVFVHHRVLQHCGESPVVLSPPDNHASLFGVRQLNVRAADAMDARTSEYSSHGAANSAKIVHKMSFQLRIEKRKVGAKARN